MYALIVAGGSGNGGSFEGLAATLMGMFAEKSSTEDAAKSATK